MADDKPLGLEPRERSSYDPLLDAAAQVAEERRAEMEEADRAIDRAARRRTLLIGAVVVFSVLVLSGIVATLTTRRPTSRGAVAVGTDIFSADGLAVPGGVAAQFSPDGTRLAVLRGGGAFGLSEGGRFRPLVPEEAAITAHAWFDGNRLLVQEGPVSTGQLAAVDLKGESKGVIKLTPDVPPGQSLAVSPDRLTVILSSVTDSNVPGVPPTTDLYSVAVVGGATARLTTTPEIESRLFFLDDQRVAFTSRRDGREQVQVLNLVDQTTTPLGGPGDHAAVIGVSDGDVVWTTGSEVRAGRPGSPDRVIASVPAASVAVAISPERKRLVVRETSPEGDTILKLIRL